MPIADEDKLSWLMTLDELVSASTSDQADKTWILTLIDEAVISPEPTATTGSTLYFNSVQLSQVRRAMRLRRDFDASPQAIGLILTLLDELHGLRQLQRQRQAIQELFEIE